jgi:hypothetical protein
MQTNLQPNRSKLHSLLVSTSFYNRPEFERVTTSNLVNSETDFSIAPVVCLKAIQLRTSCYISHDTARTLGTAVVQLVEALRY